MICPFINDIYLLSDELKECADASASLDLRMERVKNTIEENFN